MKRIAWIAVLIACRTERMSSELVTAEEAAPAEAALQARLASPSPCERALLTTATRRPGSASSDQRDVLALADTGDAALAAAVSKAVAHQSACSMLEVTTNDALSDDDLDRWYAVAHEIGAHAAKLAETDAARGMSLALQGVRLFQDLQRGRVETRAIALGIAGERTILAAILTARWSQEHVPGGDRDVEILIASEPEISAAVQAYLDAIAITRRDHYASLTTDMRRALTIAVARTRGATLRACPQDSSLPLCARGLAQLVATTTTMERRAVFEEPFTAESRPAVRDKAIAFMRDEALGAFVRQVVKPRGEPLAMLAALALRLELGRANRCPTEDELKEAPWAELLAPGSLGAGVRARIVNNALEVTLPEWVEPIPVADKNHGSRGLREWTFACPAAR